MQAISGKRHSQGLANKISLPSVGEDTLLADAQAEYKALLVEGEMASCPCCGKTAKLYWRGLRSTWMKALRLLAENHPSAIHSSELDQVVGAKDWQNLVHWRLIEPSEEHGWWSTTPAGLAYLRDEDTLPSRVALWRQKVLGFSHERVYLRQLKYTHFSLNDVLYKPVKGDDIHGDE